MKKSKSLLSKLRRWKPFSVSSNKDSGHIFINLSLRVASLNALLCDSEQEFLNLSLRNLEMDTVFHPGSKMIVRTFIHDLLVEDVTQLSLFPKVISFLLLRLPLPDKSREKRQEYKQSKSSFLVDSKRRRR